jgi:hypothetical protein
MTRPFRPSFFTGIGPVIFWLAVAAGLVGLCAFALAAEGAAREECERRGGTYVRTGRYTAVCFAKGMVIE